MNSLTENIVFGSFFIKLIWLIIAHYATYCSLSLHLRKQYSYKLCKNLFFFVRGRLKTQDQKVCTYVCMYI